MNPEFSHILEDRAKMVDISHKEDSVRIARAVGSIRLKSSTIRKIREGTVEKGNVLLTARIAAILAVKNTYHLIPMCHPIPVDDVDVEFVIGDERISTSVTVKSVGKTGVEMEALVGVSIALLTIWDMVKSSEKDEEGSYPCTSIDGIQIEFKVKENAEHKA
ncbi:MAG TPA: cyclic pyranopterin monophosphate synthase MoaC [Candidatus Syntrophoarchaeum butanivorans]|uniref:Probable cyclic pyranopterin monophosphate synthase n=1 Tax=Candidatus Syntropharchaeum butanivorans TaxID=1839936 RepID=A0A7C0X2L4_9EURY|nr:MAG: cyclic pyranopterin monophosphate synthase MoaC [Candidatus Syntrophoarchaeum sp. WYZ-LMO15]HDM36131.1 cyclic pyranopterin monophosphate synthase MoaC [Candidatus Syntrophoarchaeum butanivorans]